MNFDEHLKTQNYKNIFLQIIVYLRRTEISFIMTTIDVIANIIKLLLNTAMILEKLFDIDINNRL